MCDKSMFETNGMKSPFQQSLKRVPGKGRCNQSARL